MHELDKLNLINKLKEIERKTKVKNRYETTAEHTFSALVLAEYFFKKTKKINKEKVRKLILYHDFCEIYAKDTFLPEERELKKKEKLEDKAVKRLEKELPKEIAEDLTKYWKEWLAGKTSEAKFAKSIDALDPVIQATNYPKDWKKYNITESVLRKRKEKYFTEFPPIKMFFEELIKELKKRKIIPQEK